MDALDVETRIAEGEQALQALLKLARAKAGKLEAHEAEKGLFKRLMPSGWAAMQLDFAQRGTGDGGPAVTRADGVLLPREQQRRARDSCSRFGTFAVARTCDRTPEAPGLFPLDAQSNLPARCDADFLPEWMPVCAVEHPVKERSSWFEPRFALEVAESVWMAGAQEAPEDDEACSAPQPLPPEDTAGALLVVSVDGTGVPMSQAEATTLTATLGTGEKRQQQQEALGGSARPSLPSHGLPKHVRRSWSSRKRRARAGNAKA
jgi:hypothetical protein